MKRWLYSLQKYMPFGRFALPYAIVIVGVVALMYDQGVFTKGAFTGWSLFVSCLLGLIVLFQIVTAVIAALYTIRIKARFREVQLFVSMQTATQQMHIHELKVILQSQRLWRFLRPLVHLDYQGYEWSPGIQLKRLHTVDGPKQWEGLARWRNPLWVMHHFKGAVLRFEDILGVCSFPVYIPKTQIIIPQTPTVPLDAKDWPLQTNTQELDEQVIKRAVSDDYLQLKSYEPSDDVRRIIWRLFAKDRTLYTRTPDEEAHVKERLALVIDFSLDRQMVKEPSVQKILLHHYKRRIVGLLKYLITKEVSVNVSISGQSYNCTTANWAMITDALLQVEWQMQFVDHSDAVFITQPFSLKTLSKDKDIVLMYADFEKPYFVGWTKKIIFTNTTNDDTLLPRRYKFMQKQKLAIS